MSGRCRLDGFRYETPWVHCSDSFFFNDTAPTELYTLSLHDALPIFEFPVVEAAMQYRRPLRFDDFVDVGVRDRKSTRLNSSHGYISYAVFCLKKKKKRYSQTPRR